ncbi:MAG: RDD family protein [Acidimicrobiales bacterium]
MRSTSFTPIGEDVPLAGWGIRALGAIGDAVVVGLGTYGFDLIAGVHSRTGYAYLDLVVSFVYSFALVGFFGHTLGMAVLRLYAVDIVEGRTPVGPLRAAIRSFVAGVLTVIPLAALVDLLWPLWDARNQTIHDKAAGTLVLRQG